MSAPRLGHYDLCVGVCFGCMQCGFLRKPRCIGWCEECWGHWVMVPGPRHNRFIPPEFRIRNLGSVCVQNRPGFAECAVGSFVFI